jgi:hypothetical protein
VCLAPSRPLRSHNGVRIFWEGFSAPGLAHCRVRSSAGGNGVEEAQAAPKSRRRRTTKPVKEAGEASEGEVRLDVSDGAESDSGQRASATPASKRKSTARGRKPKPSTVDDSSLLHERQDTEDVSPNAADEANAKPGPRRRRRSSAKSGGAGKPESNPNSNPPQAEHVSATEVDGNETADIQTGKKAAPSGTRSRRRKKAAAKAPEATANGAATDVVDPRELAPDVASLGSSPTRNDEHVHGENFGEPSHTSGSISGTDVEPKTSSKASRPRNRRAKVSGDEELQSRVLETAVSSVNGSVGKGGVSGEGVESVGIHNPSVAVKKKRQRRTRKKTVAVADVDVDGGSLENSDAAQSVLLYEATGSGSEGDEAVSNKDHEDSGVAEPEESPPPRKSARRRRRDAVKLAAAQAESSEGSDTASESGAGMRSMLSMGGSVGGLETPQAGTLWSGSQVDADGGVSRIQFPAPTWGPQWWEEIQAKSQATISFQDIAERKEGFQARAKGFWLFTALDSSTVIYVSAQLG